MHFNDLLIKLRMQALAGVAALSALVGIFTKTDIGNVRSSWEIAAYVFAALCIFWIAIWTLDLRYYNRLLLGSVNAVLELEELSKTTCRAPAIQLSTLIAATVRAKPPPERFAILQGVWIFYSLVLVALVLGFALCVWKAWTAPFFVFQIPVGFY